MELFQKDNWWLLFKSLYYCAKKTPVTDYAEYFYPNSNLRIETDNEF